MKSKLFFLVVILLASVFISNPTKFSKMIAEKHPIALMDQLFVGFKNYLNAGDEQEGKEVIMWVSAGDRFYFTTDPDNFRLITSNEKTCWNFSSKEKSTSKKAYIWDGKNYRIFKIPPSFRTRDFGILHDQSIRLSPFAAEYRDLFNDWRNAR